MKTATFAKQNERNNEHPTRKPWEHCRLKNEHLLKCLDASLEEVDDSIIAHNIRTFPIMLVKRVKLTAKTVDEDPASCKRCISRKEI